jgi:carbon storage regulator
MLVLSRKRGEKIVINQNIIISVLEIRSDRVRLGIEAPDSIGIMRQELLDHPEEPTGQPD